MAVWPTYRLRGRMGPKSNVFATAVTKGRKNTTPYSKMEENNVPRIPPLLTYAPKVSGGKPELVLDMILGNSRSARRNPKRPLKWIMIPLPIAIKGEAKTRRS